MDVLAAQKEHGPLSVSTGAKNEVVTEGGEVGFVGRMMEESVAWGKQIRCARLSEQFRCDAEHDPQMVYEHVWKTVVRCATDREVQSSRGR